MIKGSALCEIPLETVLGVHSLVWDEAQKITGKDPDFHRRDLWNRLKMEILLEYELGVQMIRGRR